MFKMYQETHTIVNSAASIRTEALRVDQPIRHDPYKLQYEYKSHAILELKLELKIEASHTATLIQPISEYQVSQY